MARPKIPLISKHRTLEIALRIIDDEGLEALSIRRLAKELDVNGASLYGHFKNKDDILNGAAALALKDARIRDDLIGDWREWFMQITKTYRKSLIEHPGLVAIVLSGNPLRIALPFYDDSVRILSENGVPEKTIMPLLHTVEAFVIGSVSYVSATQNDEIKFGKDPTLRYLSAATKAARFTLGDDDLWTACCNALIDATVAASNADVATVKSATRSRKVRRAS